ncbi:MAG: hypothetical protein V3T98_01195 [Candidatus Paceibacterota bacterium]
MNFQRTTQDREINPKEKRKFEDESTHVRARVGKEGQFKSDYPEDYFPQGKKKGKFFKRPPNASHYQFKDFKSKPSGFSYGKPTFFFEKDTQDYSQLQKANPKLHPSPFPLPRGSW